jgi:hypothetical protein
VPSPIILPPLPSVPVSGPNPTGPKTPY